MKPASRPALLAALGLLLGAAHPAPPRLSGRFVLTLWIDQSPPSPAASVTGTVTLEPIATAGRPNAVGRYQVPLATGGLGPDQGPVMAGAIGGDSGEVVLNPSAKGPRMALAGRWRLGVLEGRWRWIGGSRAAAGRFLLRPAPRAR